MATFHRILFYGETARTTSGQMGTRGGRTGFLLLQTLRSCGLRFPSDSQDLTWVEGWRKEGHVLHVVLPQPLPQGKHLPHAHTGQLPSKHAALRPGRNREKESTFQPMPSPGRPSELSVGFRSRRCCSPSGRSPDTESQMEKVVSGHQPDW